MLRITGMCAPGTHAQRGHDNSCALGMLSQIGVAVHGFRESECESIPCWQLGMCMYGVCQLMCIIQHLADHAQCLPFVLCRLQAKWQAIEASGDMIAFERLQEMVRKMLQACLCLPMSCTVFSHQSDARLAPCRTHALACMHGLTCRWQHVCLRMPMLAHAHAPCLTPCIGFHGLRVGHLAPPSPLPRAPTLHHYTITGYHGPCGVHFNLFRAL